MWKKSFPFKYSDFFLHKSKRFNTALSAYFIYKSYFVYKTFFVLGNKMKKFISVQ